MRVGIGRVGFTLEKLLGFVALGEMQHLSLVSKREKKMREKKDLEKGSVGFLNEKASCVFAGAKTFAQWVRADGCLRESCSFPRLFLQPLERALPGKGLGKCIY